MVHRGINYRNLVVDNYQMAGGDLGTLKCIGINDISGDARQCIRNAFAAQSLSFAALAENFAELVCTSCSYLSQSLILLLPTSR